MIQLNKSKLQQWYVIKNINHLLGDYYFKSVGIGVGDRVQIIRKAPFNGALHIKNNLGVEFAIDEDTASFIYVESLLLSP